MVEKTGEITVDKYFIPTPIRTWQTYLAYDSIRLLQPCIELLIFPLQFCFAPPHVFFTPEDVIFALSDFIFEPFSFSVCVNYL